MKIRPDTEFYIVGGGPGSTYAMKTIKQSDITKFGGNKTYPTTESVVTIIKTDCRKIRNLEK